MVHESPVRASTRSRGRAAAGAGGRPASIEEPPDEAAALDRRLVAALDRLAVALDGLLRRTARDHGLTVLEVRVLSRLWPDGDARLRPRELAREWGVRTAEVRGAIAGLERSGRLERAAGERDGRSLRLLLTPDGRGLAATVSDWSGPLRHAIARRGVGPGEAVLPVLVDWVAALQRAHVLGAARVCPTCRFFAADVRSGRVPHHCQLLELALADADLRVDCPAHEPV